MKEITKVYYGLISILKISKEEKKMKKADLERDLFLKIKEAEGLNDIMIGCLRILDNLSRTEKDQQETKKLQDEINILLEVM